MTAHDHPLVLDQAFWDGRYREAAAIWSGNPNPQLVAEATDLPPGSALDVGCGEGADAIWLAERGWRVTGVDISPVAIERAAAHAAAKGVADLITWRHADLTAEPPGGPFDLVTAQFMHLPGAQRVALQRSLANAVAPGGTLLVVGHHPSDMATIARPVPPDFYYTAADVAALLDPEDWTVLVDAARPRPATHDGRQVTIHDAVLRAQRKP